MIDQLALRSAVLLATTNDVEANFENAPEFVRGIGYVTPLGVFDGEEVFVSFEKGVYTTHTKVDGKFVPLRQFRICIQAMGAPDPAS